MPLRRPPPAAPAAPVLLAAPLPAAVPLAAALAAVLATVLAAGALPAGAAEPAPHTGVMTGVRWSWQPAEPVAGQPFSLLVEGGFAWDRTPGEMRLGAAGVAHADLAEVAATAQPGQWRFTARLAGPPHLPPGTHRGALHGVVVAAGTPGQGADLLELPGPEVVLVLGGSAGAPHVPGGPTPLKAAVLGLDAAAPRPGQPAKVYVRLQNPTAAAAEGAFHAAVAAPGEGLGETLRSERFALGPLERRVVDVAWTPRAEGVFELRAWFGERAAGPGPGTERLQVRVARDAAPGAPALLLSAGLLNVGTIPQGAERTVPVEVTAYGAAARGVEVVVLDAQGVEVEAVTPPLDLDAGETRPYYLRVRVPLLGENQSLAAQRLLLQARAEGRASNVESVGVVVHEEGFRGVPGFGSAAGLAALGAAGGAAAFFRRHRGG